MGTQDKNIFTHPDDLISSGDSAAYGRDYVKFRAEYWLNNKEKNILEDKAKGWVRIQLNEYDQKRFEESKKKKKRKPPIKKSEDGGGGGFGSAGRESRSY